MTKTQANEPGFVQLPDGWLVIEMKAAEAEIAKWPDGLRVSFESLFRAAAPIVPAPAYGVKALRWETSIERYMDDEPKRFWLGWGHNEIVHIQMHHSSVGFEGPCVLYNDRYETVEEAKAAAQADFERRILSCLSSAPVEEADAKAGELVDKYCEGFCKGSGRPGVFDDCTGCEIARLAPPASTIPSEPEEKGEAGAGPVGEAVALLDPDNRKGPPQPTMHPNAEWCEAYARWFHRAVRFTLSSARPIEEPGEVERLTRDLDFWVVSFQVEVKARIAAEAGLAETRERLEKREAALREREAALREIASLEEYDVWTANGHAKCNRIARASLSTQESSAALAGDGKEAGL